MVICPNCGRKTSGIDFCEWCKYPLPRGSRTRRWKAQKEAEKETKLATKEERHPKKSQKQAEKEVRLAVQAGARRKAEEEKQAKEAKEQEE